MRIMSTRWNHEPERASRPFSRDRDGFVIAEGAWFFVLEEMEQARARGAHIYGEIAGYGSTCEAFHRVRLEECGEEPARAIGLAIEGGRHRRRPTCSTSTITALPPNLTTASKRAPSNWPSTAMPTAARLVAQEPDRPSRKAPAARRAWRPPCWPCATASCPPPLTWTSRTPNAIWITSHAPAVIWPSRTPWPIASPSEARIPRWC